MPVELLRYPGDPLDTTHVLGTLGVRGAYTYIVATLAMEGERYKIAPPHQRDEDGKAHLVFHKTLRLWLRQRRVPLLTRAEERVVLLRAAEQVAQDPTLARQLRHDVFAWRDALADLSGRGIEVERGLPPELEEQLVNPGVGALLLQLQATYRQLQRQERSQPFEDAASDFLADAYEPTETVILEGFTFFTPLQRRLIDAASGRGARVILLYPYRAEQSYGFEVMGTTYEPWLSTGIAAHDLPTELQVDAGDLRVLQESLFADRPSGTPISDGSVVVSAHGHRHQEVAAGIRVLQELIDNDVPPEDIAIVTRNAGNIEALLREEAELQGLPISLSIPPRLLLLTPLGRFVLTLYQVWDAGALRVNADQLETMLASGWLKADVQVTADLFSAVRAQFFTRCETEDEWMRGLDQLAQARATVGSPRLSPRLIDDRTITLWRSAVRRVRELCQRLFSGGRRSIGGHVQRLLDELTQLAPEEMREVEREVLLRIQEALNQVASAASVEMSSEEFGTVLNSLVRDYERAEDEEDETGALDDRKIWVTTPEGIDGRERKYILYLGVDSQRAPRAYAEGWPFYERAIDKHQQQERYLFLAVARAARYRLYLSYARVDEDTVLSPSPYLEEVCHLLGLDLSLPDASGEEPDVAPMPEAPAHRARRTRYTLAEIAHAGLCPYRYKLERLSPVAGIYRDLFQLQFLAEGHWLNLVMSHLQESGRAEAGVEDVFQMFHEAMGATRPAAQRMFPGLRPLSWHTIEQYVSGALRHVAERNAGDRGYSLRVLQAATHTLTVTEDDDVTTVDTGLRHILQVGRFVRRLFTDDLLFEEWLIPGAKPRDGEPQTKQLDDGREVFASLYHAVQWWRRAIMTTFNYTNIPDRPASSENQRRFFEETRQEYSDLLADLRTRIALIEAGRYPKHAGDHCRYCPVHLDCLGVEP